jgi:hypothetical protein
MVNVHWSPNYVSIIGGIVTQNVVMLSKITTTTPNNNLANGNKNTSDISIKSGGVGPSTGGQGPKAAFNHVMKFF